MQRAAFRTTLRALSESAKASNTKQTSFVKSVFTDTGNIPLVAAKYVKPLYSPILILPTILSKIRTDYISIRSKHHFYVLFKLLNWYYFWIELLDVMLYIPLVGDFNSPKSYPFFSPSTPCVNFFQIIHLSS